MEDIKLDGREEYTHVRELNGELCGMLSFLFTHAIIRGIHQWGYSDRWCYHTTAEAIDAFEQWDGKGDPAGLWTRAMISGEQTRKRAQDGNVYYEHSDAYLQAELGFK